MRMTPLLREVVGRIAELEKREQDRIASHLLAIVEEDTQGAFSTV